nr:unnamed protein product [Callosobruchus chinensis]
MGIYKRDQRLTTLQHQMGAGLTCLAPSYHLCYKKKEGGIDKTVNQNISTFNNSKRAFKLSQATSLQAGVSPRWTPGPTDPPLQSSSPQRTEISNISQEPAPRAAQQSQGKDLQEIEQVNKPAGRLLFFHSEWSKITDDKMVLSWIKG